MSPKLLTARKATYVERNQHMIKDSDYCIFYYLHNNGRFGKGGQSSGSSGTQIAYNYAVKQNKTIFNVAKL